MANFNIDAFSGKNFLFLRDFNGSGSGVTFDVKYVNRFDAFSSLSVINSWETIPSFSLITSGGGNSLTYFISVNLGLRTFNGNTEIQVRLSINGNPLNYSLRATRRPSSYIAGMFPVHLQATEVINNNSTITVEWNTNIAPVEFTHGSIYLLGIPNTQIL
jgi:hypothetical protein